MFDVPRMKNIEPQRCHEQRSTGRDDLQNGQARLGAYILCADSLLARICCESEKSSQNIHGINVVMPDLEPTETEIDSQDPIP
jgi:hypothetical protein